MKLHAKSIACGCAILLALAACAEREVLLPGERLDIRTEAPLGSDTPINEARAFVPAPPVVSANWTHLGGSPRHTVQHPALSATLTPLWSQSIGQGNGRKHRITADPVVLDGRIFTLDSRARVAATSTSGAPLWQADLTPPADRADDASGGGLAVAGNTLFATTGFGEVTALDVTTGEVRWVHDFDAAATGAPTVSDGVVYVVTLNEIGWALDASNGRVLWQVLGAPSSTGIAGGPAPAIADDLVIFPFGSAQLIGAVKGPGTQVWSASVAGQRPGRAFSRVSDLTGDPLVDGGVVYAGSHAGRAGAFDLDTGVPIWRADEGAISPLWRAGDSLFMVSDRNQLVRLDAATGTTVWAVDLPLYTRTRIARRKGTFTQYGPVLAGGRLLVPSDDGVIRQFDPEDGALLAAIPLPQGAATNPVVAGGTLYLVTEDGQLRAFR